MKGFVRRHRFVSLAVLGVGLWLALPLYPLGPTCINRRPGPDYPTFYGMSPLYQRVFAAALQRYNVQYVVLGGWFFTWPWTAWGRDYTDATLDVGTKAVDGYHLLAGDEEVLVGQRETVRAVYHPS